MAKRDTDVSTRALLRRYWKNVQKHNKHDRWIGAHSGESWWSEYKRHVALRSHYRNRVAVSADVLKERGVYLG